MSVALLGRRRAGVLLAHRSRQAPTQEAVVVEKPHAAPWRLLLLLLRTKTAPR